jgi:fatty-acyl-CoA synthase
MSAIIEHSVTPTVNSIPIRHGDFFTATDALAYAAQGEAGFNFFNVFGQLTDVLSYKTLQNESMKAALYLQQQGLPRGSRVITIAETSADFLIFLFACQYSGLIPCPTAFSVQLGGIAAYQEKLTQLLRSSQAAAIACSQKIVDYIHPLTASAGKSVLIFETFSQAAKQLTETPTSDELQPFNADEPAYIQFSSGSTHHPKGVQITQRHLHANISVVLKDGMKLRAEDRSFNWLPFHHNMGLIGFMFGSVYGQRSVDCLSAESFIQNPLIWLELMTRYQTAITFSPIFGYQLAMKAYLEKDPKPSLDLSTLRIAGIGGDMISADMLKGFSSCFASSGFQHKAFLPSYGLTETTLAVSTADTELAPLTDMLSDSITRQEIVSCGKPLPGFEVKIIHPDSGQALDEHQVGQIWVKGDSVVSSYIDEQHQIAFDSDGFFYTGDLGYLYQQQLFISGREKDVIIIRGRNIWAQDIEWIVLQNQPHLGINNVAAVSFTEHQQETLLILVSLPENTQDKSGLEQLSLAIQKIVSQAAGIPSKIYFTHDKLPLTASGKLARAKAKESYLNQQLRPIYSPGDQH